MPKLAISELTQHIYIVDGNKKTDVTELFDKLAVHRMKNAQMIGASPALLHGLIRTGIAAKKQLKKFLNQNPEMWKMVSDDEVAQELKSLRQEQTDAS